jgi:hypothetical protein
MSSRGPESEISLRAVVVYLKSPFGGALPAHKVSEAIGNVLSKSQVNRIYSVALERGFNPSASNFAIKDEYIENSPRTGRPSKQTDDVIRSVTTQIETDRFGREKNCADIAGELEALGVDISRSTVWRILRTHGYKKTKPTRKPGLSKPMRTARLRFAREHEHWSLEDWKNVIWSDETSVVIGHRRGGYRVWRKSSEAFIKSCIRERWAGYSEFMFWACFSYDTKGPCHIWKKETPAEKKAAQRAIDEMNEELEPRCREEWELNTAMRRVGLRNKPGVKPQWNWTKESGKLVRETGKGGIDWWRYQSKVLVPLLIPFAQRCMRERPNMVVQEDKAPSHAHRAQARVFNLYKVARLLWPGNSPDLNAIEPAWYWMKRKTTAKGAAKSRDEAVESWLRNWKELPQCQIQAWVERIPHHIAEIIRLEGGNEYKEGRPKHFDMRIAPDSVEAVPMVPHSSSLEDSGEESSGRESE